MLTNNGKYWIDENGNRWDMLLFGEKDAEQARNSLLNCTNCTDCNSCTDCTNCNSCTDCTNCNSCTGCTDCTDCTDCKCCFGCADCNLCTDCRNCKYCVCCRNCTSCIGCANCNLCIDCYECIKCTRCIGCDIIASFEDNPQRIVSPILGTRQSNTTMYWDQNKVVVRCGCFSGSLTEFKAAIRKTHGDNEYAKQYFAWLEKAERYINEVRL